ETSTADIVRQHALEHEQLVGPLRPTLFCEEDLGHTADPQSPHNLEVGKLARNCRKWTFTPGPGASLEPLRGASVPRRARRHLALCMRKTGDGCGCARL